MKVMQPTLINYAEIQHIYTHMRQFGNGIILSQAGVIHSERVNCHLCNRLCCYNGSNKSGHLVGRSEGSFFKKGQQYCKHCAITIQVDNEFIDRMKDELNRFIISQIVSLRKRLNSFGDIAGHLGTAHGLKISKETVREIYDAKMSEYDDLEFEYEVEDGFYGYDEQYITINGERFFRVVIFDYKNNRPIYEEKHKILTKKILEQILRKVFGDEKPKGFVFDMRTMYPNAFRRVFGKKIKLQFCVFHLNKLILGEYRASLKVGRKVKWNLTQYYNMYLLFNIFYDREKQLEIVAKFQKCVKKFKVYLENLDDIDKHGTMFKVKKKCKTDQGKIDYLCRQFEKRLMKSFRKHLHQDKLRRKREKITLTVRSEEDARKKLNEVIATIQYFPKKIQERIKKIDENFDLFTGSDGELLTNNKLEGFFGSTLKKFRKKGFHSDKGLQNFLNFQKIKQNGIQIIETFSFKRLGVIFGILTFFA